MIVLLCLLRHVGFGDGSDYSYFCDGSGSGSFEVIAVMMVVLLVVMNLIISS